MKNIPRDNFQPHAVETLAKRAAYICSNPDCRSLTLSPALEAADKFIMVGIAAHITAAAPGGPRYDSSLTSEQRSSIENGVFLCSNCAAMIDKNNGLDFTVETLHSWKREHEVWVRQNLNKSLLTPISTIDGEHFARGKGTVTGLDAQGPVLFRPGTRVVAEGEGNITATRIGFPKDKF